MSAPDQALRGRVVDGSDETALRHAIELAFDYRGDVTIVRRGEAEPLEGYVFDRRTGPTLASSTLRLIPQEGEQRVTIPYDQIAELRFTGRDTAAGRSFEAWMKRYVEKKLRGESASIESATQDAP